VSFRYSNLFKVPKLGLIMNKLLKIVLIYILIFLFFASPVLLIPFMGPEYMQVGWVFLYFTVPVGMILFLVYTVYLIYKKIRSRK
jgi:hypothetical protein